MPFQPINFAGIQPQQGPDLISTLMQGYQMGQMPAQMQRQAQQEQLANQIKQMQLQQSPEEFKTSQALREAQIQEALQRSAKEKQEMQKQQMIQNMIFGTGRDQQPGQNNMAVSPEMKQLMIRSFMGLPAQLPSEQLAREKEMAYYRANLRPVVPPMAQTTFLKKIQSADALLPLLDQISEHEGSSYWEVNPNLRKSYETSLTLPKEKLMGTMSIPKIKQSYGDVDKALRRGPTESQDAYKERISMLKKDVLDEVSGISDIWPQAPTLKYVQKQMGQTEKSTPDQKTPIGTTTKKRLKFNPQTGGFE